LTCLDGEIRGFPGSEAAGDFRHRRKIGSLEQACGDGRAIATGAIDEKRAISGKRRQRIGEMAEGNTETSGDEFAFSFAGSADINDQWRLSGIEELGSELRAKALRERDDIGARLERFQAVLKISGDVVKADAAETNRGFVFAARSRNDNNGMDVI